MNLLDLINRYHNTLRAYNGQGEQVQRCWSELKQSTIQAEAACAQLELLGFVWNGVAWAQNENVEHHA